MELSTINELGKIRVGVSQCLMGDAVRYDGDTQPDAFVRDTLSQYWSLEPLCPEMAIGLGVPRPPVRIIENAGEFYARGVADVALDVTAPLAELVTQNLSAFIGLDGFLLMARSPSCGLGSVKRHDLAGNFIARDASGIFAAQLQASVPWLPLIEAVKLIELDCREQFIARVCALADFRVSVERDGVSAKKLIAFYSRYKYQVMSHSNAAYKTLGKLLGDLSTDVEAKALEFKIQFSAALARPATKGSHLNALQHLSGYFNGRIVSNQYASIVMTLQAFARGELTLAAAIQPMLDALPLVEDDYLRQQSYWYSPYPTLSLRDYIPQ